jgi:hypothetical protein
MLEPTPIASASITAHLRALLEEGTSGLDDEGLAEARSLGPELAGDLVASLVESELSCPAADGTAIRAVHLASELRLARAVPALVRCIELLDDVDPLRLAALAAVARLGPVALEALLSSFEQCSTTEARARIAEALSRTAVEDDRLRSAFTRMLEDDPEHGAHYLADHGDWRAVPDLSRAVDRLSVAPAGNCDCAICTREQLMDIASAIHALGGALSEEQAGKIDQVTKRAEALWTPFKDPFASRASRDAPRAPVLRDPRPSRNAPCHCGSGKKYKKCHLEADEREARH